MGTASDEMKNGYPGLLFGTVVFSEALSLGEKYDSPEGQASTEDALPLCKRWLQTCRLSHKACNSDQGLGNFHPTRLIDLVHPVPRIHLAEELPRNGQAQYATLSHCWGTLKFTVLTTTNLEAFRHGLPLHELPKTFIDAIWIARKLGFGYLWIDSLCILQDSTEDWVKESNLMTQVYGRSSLNIAATSASNGSVGCFFNRAPDWRCQLLTGGRIVEVSPKQWLDPDRPSNALAKRAWVVQERYLPRRTLHFDDLQVSWECDENPACEIYPSGYPRELSADLGYRWKKRPLTKILWPDIVEMYSIAKLTKVTDKLVGIGGLARLIQETTKDEYVAGMWREGLEYQLLWSTGGPATTSWPKRLNTGTPTWTWASMDGPVFLPRNWDTSVAGPTRLCVRVHDVHIEYSSVNPYGGISSANLRLSCEYFYPGSLEPASVPWWTHRILLGGPSSESPHQHCSGGESSRIFDQYLDVGSVPLQGPVPVYILPVVMLEDKCGSSHIGTCFGLILEPTGSKKGEYRRLAHWKYEEQFPAFSEVLAGHDLVAQRSVGYFAEVSTEAGKERFFIDLV